MLPEALAQWRAPFVGPSQLLAALVDLQLPAAAVELGRRMVMAEKVEMPLHHLVVVAAWAVMVDMAAAAQEPGIPAGGLPGTEGEVQVALQIPPTAAPVSVPLEPPLGKMEVLSRQTVRTCLSV